MLRDLNDPMISTYEVMTGMPGTLATPVRIDLIDSIGRLREVDLQKVAALKASIEEIGLHTPIYVTGPRAGSDDEARPRVRLVAGAHRLEAMRQLGREWIGAYYYDGDDLDAELWEIDENLCRAELTPADRALCVFRRKEIYLMKHPETAHGAVGNGREKSRQLGDSTGEETKRFTTATAEATGQSERAVQRDAERGEKISDKALRMLRGTHHDKGTTLDRLKSLRTDEQEVYVKALFDSDKEKIREAKALRDSKQKLSRSVRFEIIKAIADKGAVRTGEMPVAAFPVVYADPPWEQESYSEETGQDKGLRYPAMPLDEIKALCAGERSPATRDAILLLWTTASRLKDGLDVMAAWGFAYKSHLVWDKVNIGMGRWVRDRHELLLIGTRGDFPGLIPGTQPHSVHSEVKGPHSVKPTWFAGEIDRLFPDLPKLELFQRKESLHFADVRNGPTWSFWGFEAGDAAIQDAAIVVRPPSPLPPAPGRTAPVEFHVGGMRKGSFARFSVDLNDDNTYSIAASYEIAGLCGGESPRTGSVSTFETALRLGLAEIGGRLREVVADASSVCTSGHKAAAKGGLRWVSAKLEEWGLGVKPYDAPAPLPVSDKKPKVPKEKRSAWQIEQEERLALRMLYRATLPDDDVALIDRAREELRTYDSAVRQASLDDMKDAADRVRAVHEHAFGLDPRQLFGTNSPPDGNGRFHSLSDASKWLQQALATQDGEVPLFGQPGRFLIELFGCRVDFKYGGLFGYIGGDAHVVDLDKPFFSETGYRSFQVCPDGGVIWSGGLDVVPYLERVCTTQFTEGGKKKAKLHGPPLGTSWVRGKEKGFDDQTEWLLKRREEDPAYQPGGFLFGAGTLAPAASEAAE